MMSEEMIKIYDEFAKIEKAKDLAEDLGYLQGYYGNLMYDIDEPEAEYYKLINECLGTTKQDEWPDEVKKALREGYEFGWWES